MIALAHNNSARLEGVVGLPCVYLGHEKPGFDQSSRLLRGTVLVY